MTSRKKDGKVHRYWNIVESHRLGLKCVVQKHVPCLDEINDAQREAWTNAIEVLEDGKPRPKPVALFPEDRPAQPRENLDVIHVRVSQIRLERPRQWGACWLALQLWAQLRLDDFWGPRLPPSREGTRWLDVLKTLACHRLISPGSEWRLHRQWHAASAIGDLLGANPRVLPLQNLYRCLDKITAHKDALFTFLKQRWQDLFNASFDVLLYDLTSTYFECDAPAAGKRKFGHSRDKRPDGVQVVIALIVTPEGLPLCYEVIPGNTADRATLRAFLRRVETLHGKARRVWVMDRGIPTEDTLAEMRASDPPVHYLVGTPKARLNALEAQFVTLPWEDAREGLCVKLLKHENETKQAAEKQGTEKQEAEKQEAEKQDSELYILARSDARRCKERAMRQRRLKRYWQRLRELQSQTLTRDGLLMKLGAAKKDAGHAARLVDVHVPPAGETFASSSLRFTLDKSKLRQLRQREGHYLLRSNLAPDDPSTLWRYYMQLVQVEQAFKTLKSDLSLRPVYHSKDTRIEAHIFVAFLAYCLQVTLQQRLAPLAGGLTARSVLETFAAMQMVDIRLPTTDGKELLLSRYTAPGREQQLLLTRLDLHLPPQPQPELKEALPPPAAVTL